MTLTELIERNELLDRMDAAAYDCTGMLRALLAIHDAGVIQLPEQTVAPTREMLTRFMEATAEYHRINVIDKMKEAR
jgi:hypothetical protein